MFLLASQHPLFAVSSQMILARLLKHIHYPGTHGLSETCRLGVHKKNPLAYDFSFNFYLSLQKYNYFPYHKILHLLQ